MNLDKTSVVDAAVASVAATLFAEIEAETESDLAQSSPRTALAAACVRAVARSWKICADGDARFDAAKVRRLSLIHI